MNEHLIDIPGRLHSVAVEEHVAGTDQIYDDFLKTTLDILNLENITDVRVQDGKLLFLNIQGLVLKEISIASVITQKQSDWNLTDSTQVDFIKGKPTVYNKLEVDDKLITKQDTISDLATIRSGAQAGATAYQKPSTGIPATDLASAVQVLLGKADTALQEHQSLAGLVNTGSYNTVSKKIELRHDNTVLAEIDATAFIKDGMVSSVTISNGYLVITFNTDAGKEPISIALTDIFNPANYYDKDDVDGLLAGKVDKETGKGLSTNDYTTAEKTKLGALPTNSELSALLNGKASKDLLDEVIRKAYMDANNSEIITDSDNMQHFILSGTGTLVDSGLYTTSRYAYFDTNTRTIGGVTYEKTLYLSGFSSYPTFYIHCPFGGQLHLSILTDDYARFTIVGHHINEQYESSFVGTIEVDAGEDISITHTGREKRIWIGEIKLTCKDYLERTATITLLNNKVDKVAGKGLSANDYTTDDKDKLNALPTAAELTEEFGSKANSADLAEVATSGSYNDLSDKPDLSAFITNSVDNLVNYYLKSETYTKTEVQQLIGAIQQFHYEVYPTLPQTGVSNVLYLIGPTGSGSDKYEEYVYANNDWTKIGDTSIDLSGYVTTQALTTALADYVTSSALSVILANTVAESGVYDVTANNNNAKFASLSALLSSENLDTLIPSSKRKGGMSIKFVLSSDNKYVQFRLMADSFSANVEDWQGVDNVPTANSKNLVTSGGVYDALLGEYVVVTATAQTIAVTDLLPTTGNAGTIYRVGNWDGTQYNDSVFSEYAWNGSAYIKLSTKSQVGEVYDISANHADTKYSDLATALGANGANIPQSLRKGGMSIKFVQSSDNKYVQYRLMSDTFNTTVANWQGVDDKPTAGSENLVKSGGAFDYTKSIVPFVATSNTLADAIAEVPTKERYVGKFVEFTDANGNHQKYKYMGKYYTDEDWNSVASATTFGAWLDLNNADKYRVYYFRLTPTKEGTILGNIDSNGDITTGTREVSDYIEIPEGGVTITGGWYARYVLYDENKTKLSSALLYGGKTFSRTDGRYVRAVGALNWKIGVEKGSASTTYPRKPHVEVVENYEDLIDYNDADGWGADYSPYIRLKKGETVRVCDKNGNPIKSYISYQQYDIDYNISGQAQVRMSSFTMSIDGYVKIGGVQKAQKIAAACRLSKSLSITTAKKRLLVVGDSISIYTYSSELSTDVAQGYPYFTAIDGEHEISVTNQAVSGNNCSAQFTALQSRDLSVYDAITILIGTNDYGYNSTITAFKTTLKTMVEYIIAQKPSIKIGLLTLIHRASAWDNTNNTEIPNAAGALLSQFSQAIREVGQEYSIPVLDLWNECQCNFNYETYVANYSSTASNTDGDGLHPTNEAHKMFIYPLYREFIKRLFAE